MKQALFLLNRRKSPQEGEEYEHSETKFTI